MGMIVMHNARYNIYIATGSGIILFIESFTRLTRLGGDDALSH